MNLLAKPFFLVVRLFPAVNIEKIEQSNMIAFNHSIFLLSLRYLCWVSHRIEQIWDLKHSCNAKNLLCNFPVDTIYIMEISFINLLEFRIVAAILGSIGSSTSLSPISLVSCASSSKAPNEYKTSRLRIKLCLLGGQRKSKFSKFLIPSAFSCNIN
jgi:hypothetical protein